jgi:anthranilate synthase/aminodeoxychorismate synthase-like glutamine amidotransferase
MKPRAMVISPGPCTPREAGISMAAIHELSGRVPILGICLGHQCIGSVFGGEVVRARQPRHGRGALISHDGNGLFAGLPSPHGVGLYHSLAIEVPDSNASPLLVTARSADGDIMAVAHRSHPTYGVQFHPESILTQQGHRILANFLAITGEAAMTAAR